MQITTTTTREQLYYTFASMHRHGGSFCAALALAWCKGDSTNKRRIEDAFPHLLEDFGPGSRYYSEVSI
jgi:hypothetical protein